VSSCSVATRRAPSLAIAQVRSLPAAVQPVWPAVGPGLRVRLQPDGAGRRFCLILLDAGQGARLAAHARGRRGAAHDQVSRALGGAATQPAACRYHLGSVALGSLLLASVQLIRFVLKMVQVQASETKDVATEQVAK